MPREPLISIIVCVKNGMPYLPQAMESLAAQSYETIEIIVQDGGSDDGSLEVLRAFSDLPVHIASSPDSGVGQAYNRAVKRCRGDIIGSLDADNLLKPDALRIVVETLRQRPEAAAIYGSVQMIDTGGQPVGTFEPAPFELLRLLFCELVPPWSAAFFSRRVCGDLFYIDETFRKIADFDVWLRLSHLPIIRTERILGCTRLSDKSMTCRPEEYDDFCREKILAVDKYLNRFDDKSLRASVLRHSICGIYCWGAESVFRLHGSKEMFERFLRLAEEANPQSIRVEKIRRESQI